MSFELRRISFCTDGFSRTLEWSHDFIGTGSSTSASVNVEVEGFGDLDDTPSSIALLISTRPPNRDIGVTSLLAPVAVDAPATVLDAGADTPGRSLFQASFAPSAIGLGAGAAVGLPRASTITRSADPHLGPATSDGWFRVGLSTGLWSPRGRATQVPGVNPGTHEPVVGGSDSDESPDAKMLLVAGGIEVIEARPSPFGPGGLVAAAMAAVAPVRSPSVAVYYSGHGLFSQRCLAVRPNALPVGAPEYVCWAKPTDLMGWHGLTNPRTLIIAGCSVLSVALVNPQSGPGLDWVPLLKSRGGPIENLLGYGATVLDSTPEQRKAPADDPVGNKVAQGIGEAIARNSNMLPRDWLELNAAHRAWNAVAIDGNAVLWHMTHVIGTTTPTIHQTPIG